MSSDTETTPDELPDDIRALADKCQEAHVRVVNAIVSGEYASNTQAYMSVYPATNLNSANTSVARMLAIDSVRALYTAMRDASLMRTVMTRAEAMDILSKIARTSLSDLVDFQTVEGIQYDKDGEKVETKQSYWHFKDSVENDPDVMRVIAELTATKDGIKIKTHDQKAAIKQLADMAGWNEAQKLDVNHKGGITHIESEYVGS